MVFKDKLKRRAIKSTEVRVLEKINYNDVLLKPIVTEKSMKVQETLNKYAFVVHKDSNKNDVKVAIKLIYNVDPEAINIIHSPYKWRNRKPLVRKEYKKAIVTLKQWDKIEIVK